MFSNASSSKTWNCVVKTYGLSIHAVLLLVSKIHKAQYFHRKPIINIPTEKLIIKSSQLRAANNFTLTLSQMTKFRLLQIERVCR